jgi:quercetin 2,3-dioxygenase
MPTDAVLSIAALDFHWPTLDPFLFCAYHNDEYPSGNAKLGPQSSLAGRNIGSDFAMKDGWRMYHGDVVPGFPRHPHRGFETVTVARRGFIDHADSLGAKGRMGNGDVQWMTAGAGIVHSEMFPLVNPDAPNPTELFQLWLNLPAEKKGVAPYYTMLWAEGIPRRVFRDADGRETEVTVVAGALADAKPPTPPPDSWASQDGSDIAIWSIRMAPNATWMLPPGPAGTNRVLYAFKGATFGIGGRDLTLPQCAQLRPEVAVALQNGPQEAELLLLQGRPIGEPVAHHGPFVMNTRAELEQAYTDYRATQFGGWPWDRDDPVHGRQGRFAIHGDGKEEEPV